MPPGFEDKKEENAFGDAIIWEEIVQDIKAASPDGQAEMIDAIVVSRDMKRDWVSSAPLVLNDRGKTQGPNQKTGVDVALPHPMLVHDFQTRGCGGRLYVATPVFLATALHRDARNSGQASPVQHWLAASHRPQLLSRLFEDEKEPNKSPTSTTTAGSGASAVPSISPSAQSADDTYFTTESSSSVMRPDVVEEVRQFKDALPQEQPALVEMLTQRLQTGAISAFAIGRILAQVSSESVVGWPEAIPALLEQLSTKVSGFTLNGIALSLLTSIYFDRYGEPYGQPMAALAAVCLSLETNPRLELAIRCLNRFLREHDVKLPYLPGGSSRVVNYAIDTIPSTAPRVLRDVRIGQQPVLTDSLSSTSVRRLSVLLGRTETEGCTGQELRALLAREYLIPISALSAQFDQTRYTWSADRGLVAVDTGVEGGISALANEEDTNE